MLFYSRQNPLYRYAFLLRDNLNYLIKAIEETPNAKNHGKIQHVLHRARILSKDMRFLKFVASKDVYVDSVKEDLISTKVTSKTLIDALDKGVITKAFFYPSNPYSDTGLGLGLGLGYRTLSNTRSSSSHPGRIITERILLIDAYKEELKLEAKTRKNRNRKNTQAIIMGLAILALSAFVLTGVAYIVFSIVVASLANPAIAMVVAEMFLRISFLYVCLGSLGAIPVVAVGSLAWQAGDKALDEWSTNSLVNDYNKHEKDTGGQINTQLHDGISDNRVSTTVYTHERQLPYDVTNKISELFNQARAESMELSKRSCNNIA